MKKILFFIVGLILVGYGAYAQKNGAVKIKWYTFEEAVKLNEASPKKIFIDVYTDWCGWCKTMDEKTFSNPVIAEYLNSNYYPVKFNAESTEPISFQGKVFENKQEGRRSTHELAIALLQGKLSYPSVAYMDENNQLLTAVPGYYPPSQIEPILVYFGANHYKSTTWDDFRKSFTGNAKD